LCMSYDASHPTPTRGRGLGTPDAADTLATRSVLMMFSTRAEYGVRVMVELGAALVPTATRELRIAISEIADGDGLPLAYSRAPGRPALSQGGAGREPARCTTGATCSRVPRRRSRWPRSSRRWRALDRTDRVHQRGCGRASWSALGRRRRTTSAPPSCCGRGCAARSCARSRRPGSPTFVQDNPSPSPSPRSARRLPQRATDSSGEHGRPRDQEPARPRRGPRDPQGASTWRYPRARSTRSWARTGPASPRWPTRSWATRHTRSPRARSPSRARTSPRPTRRTGAQAGLFLAFQYHTAAIPGVIGGRTSCAWAINTTARGRTRSA